MHLYIIKILINYSLKCKVIKVYFTLMPYSLHKSVLVILRGMFLRAQSTYRTQFEGFLISVLLHV
jgi:hypothetical protein